jgi:site-specific DNA-methyltransferase (adenine-specific)
MFKTERLSDNITIHCGDCREVIPTLDKVDAVVCDPPFGIEELVGGYGRGKVDSNIINDRNLDVMVDAFNAVEKKFNDIWIVAFYSCRITPVFFKACEKFKYFGEVIWDKRTLGLGNQIRYQHENAAFFKLGNPPDLKQIASVQTYLRPSYDKDRTVHPHEKPTHLMFVLCESVPGKIILDPFMGTGSTGAACARLRRGFVGIEFDPKYFDFARKKINAALAQPFNFWEDPVQPATP